MTPSTSRSRDAAGTPRLTEAEILALQPYRGRTIRQLARRVGDIVPLIRGMARQRRPVRVLEVGAGFGTVLVQLRQRFGDRVELHGINKRAFDGDWSVMRRSALAQGIATKIELRRLTPPALHFVNVDRGLPFPDASFDLVYSQVSFFYYEQKARFLEEVNRVLTVGGTARIDVMIHRPEIGAPYSNCFEIWEGPRRVPFWEYARRFAGLRQRRAESRPYLEMCKVPTLDLGLDLVHAVRLNKICAEWWGTKSVFAVRPRGAEARQATGSANPP